MPYSQIFLASEKGIYCMKHNNRVSVKTQANTSNSTISQDALIIR